MLNYLATNDGLFREIEKSHKYQFTVSFLHVFSCMRLALSILIKFECFSIDLSGKTLSTASGNGTIMTEVAYITNLNANNLIDFSRFNISEYNTI